MANITRYRTAKGENRYRVRYRKPDGTQTDKRGFRRKIDAETWAAEHVTIAKATGSYIDPEGGKQRIGTLHDQWIAEKKPFWKATSGSNMDSAWKMPLRGQMGRTADRQHHTRRSPGMGRKHNR